VRRKFRDAPVSRGAVSNHLDFDTDQLAYFVESQPSSMPAGMDRAQSLLFAFVALLVMLGIVGLFTHWLPF
jgi:hypothetical protein